MKGNLLRIMSLIMLVIAIIFLSVALSHPELGGVFYIGAFKFSVEVWRVFYACYVLLMIGLFISSFLIGKRQK